MMQDSLVACSLYDYKRVVWGALKSEGVVFYPDCGGIYCKRKGGRKEKEGVSPIKLVKSK